MLHTTAHSARSRAESRTDRIANPVGARRYGRVIVAAVVLAVLTIGWAGPVGSTDSDTHLKSVQFDLVQQAPTEADSPLGAQGASESAHYRLITISDGGADATLSPLGGTVRLTVAENRLATMAAERNGTQIGHGSEGFVESLADVVSSASAHSFVRVGSYDGGQPTEFNLFYDRPLGAGDYLLVQEVGGDATIEVTPIDGAGTAIGPGRQVGPGYQWNTGHGPISEPTAWASVVAVASLSDGDQPAAGFRVAAADAQLKILALTAPAASPLPPAPALATTTPIEQTEPVTGGLHPEHAAVGLETKIQPAIAVGGVGCIDGPDTDPAALVTGQAATFCFIVTNLGSTNLTNLAITDELLGLAGAVLPKAAGPEVLKPGEQAVFYYHTVLGHRPAGAVSSVTASVIDEVGAPVEGVITPTAASNTATAGSAAPAAGTAPVSAPIESQSAPLPQPPAPIDQAPIDQAGPAPAGAPAPAVNTVNEAAPTAVTQLAMTGVPTDPWVLVIFAMAFIFIGYTAYAAFQKRASDAEPSGHDQLDSFGFE